MSFASSPSRSARGGTKKRWTLAGGVLCFVLIAVSFVWRPHPEPDSSGSESAASARKKNPPKSQAAWNLALGDVVMVAPELGLVIKNAKEMNIDSGRVATLIDSQLTSVRELYRAEGEKQAALMGGLLIEFTVGHSGQVGQAREITSRISNAEFRRAIVAEVNNWNFNDAVPEGVTIQCPLLFVREGMEITTLLKWEKSLGLFDEKFSLNPAHAARATVSDPPLVPLPENLPSEGKATEGQGESTALTAPTRDSTRGKKPQVKAAPATVRKKSNAAVEQEPRAEASEM